MMSAWHDCQVSSWLVRRMPDKMQRLIMLEDMLCHTAHEHDPIDATTALSTNDVK